VHKKGALLLLISLIIVIIISIVWEDEKPDTTPIPIENTTVIIPQTDAIVQEEERFKLEKKQEIPAVELPKEELSIDKIPAEETNISAPKKATHLFTLVNTKNQSHEVTLSDQKITLLQNEKPIIMLNLFATWCPPCIGQIAYFNDLQKKYQKELFVTGILTHDNIDKPSLETFMAKQQINYFISHTTDNDAFASLLANELQLDENFSIPLTVIYVDGEYFTHYEGIVPVEMIEYDIQQAKKQLKSR
jgi:thiol-disulfide isomerase/thioredoxin